MKGLASCVLVLALAVIPAGPAQAFPPNVELDEFTVTPTTFVSTPGDMVTFGNAGLVTHTATQDAPFKLWDTGDIAPLGVQGVDMNWSGTLKFHCQYHPGMKGKIRTLVQTGASPVLLGTPVPVGFGQDRAPAGMKYESQVSRNGGDWKPFAFTRAAIRPFEATKAGVYDFRSRVVIDKPGDHKDPHSGWSPLDPGYSQVLVVL